MRAACNRSSITWLIRLKSSNPKAESLAQYCRSFVPEKKSAVVRSEARASKYQT
jgi:hypothetical protein